MNIKDTNILKTFEKNLSELMTRKKVSQTDLANKLGISSANIHRYLSGKVEPKITAIDKIARAMDIEAHELLLPNQPKETPTITTLSKLIEKQSKLLDGNEELLELWNKLNEQHKEVLIAQIRNFAQVDDLKKDKKA